MLYFATSRLTCNLFILQFHFLHCSTSYTVPLAYLDDRDSESDEDSDIGTEQDSLSASAQQKGSVSGHFVSVLLIPHCFAFHFDVTIHRTCIVFLKLMFIQ